MKELFLCSSFKDTAGLFAEFAGPDLDGKRVTFIPTASLTEDVDFYVKAGRKALEGMGLIVEEVEVSTADPLEATHRIEENDLLYITGGNTFFLLQELRRSGVDKAIKDHVDQGKPYIGESAGAIIMSPDMEYATKMDDPRAAPDLPDFTGLDVVDFYTVPHQGGFPFKAAIEKIIAKYGDALPLKPISNKQAISVKGASIQVLG